MSLLIVLLVILIVFGGIGYAPNGWAANYGYWPGGLIGIVVLLILLRVLGVF